jgi:hypothetical protein
LTLNTLFLRKLLVAFIGGFAFALLQKLTNVGPAADYGSLHAIWAGLLSGAVFAGIRAVLVLLPGVNIVPSDAGGPTGASETPAAPTPAPKQ